MSSHQHMNEMDKLAHLLSHWQEHNEEHVANYRAWAEKAEKEGKTEAAEHLKAAADITAKVTELFAKAKMAL